MEIDEPIQQLLKNTGWTCEDLLEKLQKYKSQTENKKQTSIEIANENSVIEKVNDATKNNKENPIHLLKEVHSDTNKEDEGNITQKSEANKIKDDHMSMLHAKICSIIEENTSKSRDDIEEQEVVNEVKVIELGEDEEDDYFEEESSHNILNPGSLKLNSQNIEYLETFPRKATIKPIDSTDGDDMDDDIEENIIELKAQEGCMPEELSEETTSHIDQNLETSGNISISEENSNSNKNCTLQQENAKKKDITFEQLNRKSLDNIVDKRNTAIIYEINCEKMLHSKTKNCDGDLTSSSIKKSIPYSSENNDYQNVNSLEEESTVTDLEDIRNNLKLQLNCLRTRRRGHFLQQMRTKEVDSLECDTNKINLSNLEYTGNVSFKVNKDINNETVKCFEKSAVGENEESQQSDNIYNQTNALGLVILSVEGGIDLEESHNEKIIKNNQEASNITNDNDSSNTICSTRTNDVEGSCLNIHPKTLKDSNPNEVSEVFNEIRKIIRKQKQSSTVTNKNVPEFISNPTKENNNLNFSVKCTDISSLKSMENSNEKGPYLGLSADDSQSSFTNDDTSQTIDKNSPFVSNTLEEFLTENSKLNISYKVPKSGAEEGLTDSYREESPLVLSRIIKTDNEQRHKAKKSETVKAKTVAQKRKLLEKQRLKEIRRQSKIIKQTESRIAESSSDPVKLKHSYVEINNKKLWVRGTKPNVCVAKINSSLEVGPSLKQNNTKKKLSLLNELAKKSNEKIKYLPGPLSKKSILQINCQDSWETVTKVLPKIILEVTPKVGNCFPPEIICKLPKCDEVLTPDFAEFALSVLKTKKGCEETVFRFPMRYTNNQEKIIVKKQKGTPLKCNTEESDNTKCINNVVGQVIDDLIRYVEIKEIAPTLIQEEELEFSCDDTESDKMPVIAENISSIIKKRCKKKSKVELELLRLSCKVVNVEVEENYLDEKCSKPFCRLGCVCKSLKCDGMITYHCQNIGCMLECKCPREKSIEYDKLMLPPGTDILSRDTVTRIEDEAKKDLAKVEREFTQMVIHTNDKTIVVGTGGRYKTRRCTKVPPKYSDYVDSDVQYIENEKKSNVEKKDFSKKCFVSLERLNLQDIIPYCMFHNLYNCHCEGKCLKSEKAISNNNMSHEIPEKGTEQNRLAAEKKYSKNIKITLFNPYKNQKESISNTATAVSNNFDNRTEIRTSSSGRPIRVNKKLPEDFTYSKELDFQLSDCARIRGIPLHMKNNRKRLFKAHKKLTKGDFTNNINHAEKLKAKVDPYNPEMLEVDILKKQLILESEIQKRNLSEFVNSTFNIKHKRKQILEVRSDDINAKHLSNQALAIQRRKKSGSIPKRDTIVESVFDGEIIIDKRNMNLLQKMGNRTVMEGYARLLPWNALINSFNKGDIHIWCMVDQPSRLLINKSDKLPPKNYIDIRRTTQSTEVISWILTNSLPKNHHEDHVSFILKNTKDNYEICGLCTKNFHQANSTDEINSEELETTDTDKNTILFKHRDLNGIQQLLCLSKGKFKLQELVEENLAAIGETSIEKSKLYMWAALPEIYRMCKWRMIFLNSDFTFLYFTKIRYSIKYTDLLSASNTAKEANCTVILRNSAICDPYDHSAFGIYFDSHYQDRLFIGPYFKQHRDDDIETLRYINKSLVCTESFNKMQGKIDYKCGHWLIERPYSRGPGRGTIDLTNDLSFNKHLKRKAIEDVSQIVKKPKKALEEDVENHIQVLDSEPKRPEEFNRYIITNIPHLGYLGAFQHENSSKIDVSWPFENKMIRFPTVNSAVEFLQRRFSSLLQPVPETFKISIIVLTHIDLEKSKPIDASILSGHYICGEFGCQNVKTIPNDFCIDKLGTTKEELLMIFAKRAQTFIKQKIEELADIVNISKDEQNSLNIVHILNKAQKDIESLRKKEIQCLFEKDNLLQRKSDLALKAFCLISSLPKDRKKIENWKFRQILRKRSILLPQTVVEPIEISDSDEEEQQTSSPKKDQSSDLAEIRLLSPPDSLKIPSGKSSGILTPLVEDENLPKKVNQTNVSSYPSPRKLQSILKPNTTTTSNTSTMLIPSNSGVKQSSSHESDEAVNSPKKYLTGIKLVRTGEGKYVLVTEKQKDNVKPFKLISKGGKQLVIKNNQILSIKSINPPTPNNVQTVIAPENTSNTSSSPPKTIILKKSILSKTPQILFPEDKTILTQNKNNEKSLLKNNLRKSEIIRRRKEHQTIVRSTGEPTTKVEDSRKIVSHSDEKEIDSASISPEIYREIRNSDDIVKKDIPAQNASAEDIHVKKNYGSVKVYTSLKHNCKSSCMEEIILSSPEENFLIEPPDTKTTDAPPGTKDIENVSTKINESQIENKFTPDKRTEPILEREKNHCNNVPENKTTDINYTTDSNKFSEYAEDNENTGQSVAIPNGNSSSSKVSENVDPSFNKVTFLANAVSETFPSKHNSEMSIQNEPPRAAALTQTKCAADINLNESEMNKQEKEKYCTIDIETDITEENTLNNEIIGKISNSIKAQICEINEIQLRTTLSSCSEDNNECLIIRTSGGKIENAFNTSRASFSDDSDIIMSDASDEVLSNEEITRADRSETVSNKDVLSDASGEILSNKEVEQMNTNTFYTNQEIQLNSNTNIEKTDTIPDITLEKNNNVTSVKGTDLIETDEAKSVITSGTFEVKQDLVINPVQASTDMNVNEENNLPTRENRKLLIGSPLETVDVIEKKFDGNNDNSVTDNIGNHNVTSNISLSNIVNPEALLKICHTAFHNECAKANRETVKNISVSVSVKISAPVNQSEFENNTGDCSSMVQVQNGSTSPSKIKTIYKNNRRISGKSQLVKINNAIKRLSKKLSIRKRNTKRHNISMLKRDLLKRKKFLSPNKAIRKGRINKTAINSNTYQTNNKLPIYKGQHSKIQEETVIQEKDVTVGTVTQTTENSIKFGCKPNNPVEAVTESQSETSHNVNLCKKQIFQPKCDSDSNRSGTLQTNTQTLNRYRLDNNHSVNEEYLSLNNILSNNSILDLTVGSNSHIIDLTEISSSESEPQDIFSNDNVSKFPPTKRLSNIVIHTLEANNYSNVCDSAEGSTKPDATKETQRDIFPETENAVQQICTFQSRNDKKILYLCNIDNETNNNSVQQVKSATPSASTCNNGNQSRNNQVTSASSSQKVQFKRPIKYVGAKLDTAFTIDKNPFSKYRKPKPKPVEKPKVIPDNVPITFDAINKVVKKLEKKGTEQFRRRKELIRTNALITASRIITSESNESRKIAEKICFLADNMPKPTDLMNIDKENFMKNAELAEKIINIGNMRKKLNDNISEDNGTKNAKSS